jgi:hypothetical protein
MDWFNELTDKIQAVIIGSSVSAVLTLLTFLVKDYLIPIFHEKRKTKQVKIDTIKKYLIPLIQSTESLCWRLREIFDNRAAYLLEHSPKNRFNSYKYISTLYRLCALLGWIRASKQEASLVEIENKITYQNVDNKIKEIEKALADGAHMEIELLDQLSNLWSFDISTLEDIQKRKLAIQIHDIVNEYLVKEKVAIARELSEDNQVELIKLICHKISVTISCSILREEVLIEQKNTIINEISRIECWIYRDWQKAIGDLMTFEVTDFSRRFDVVGFGNFEESFFDEVDSNQKWYERINSLFEGLDVNIEDRFDARVKQLKNVFIACVDFIEELNKIETGQVIVSEESLTNLIEFRDNLRNNATQQCV